MSHREALCNQKQPFCHKSSMWDSSCQPVQQLGVVCAGLVKGPRPGTTRSGSRAQELVSDDVRMTEQIYSCWRYLGSLSPLSFLPSLLPFYLPLFFPSFLPSSSTLPLSSPPSLQQIFTSKPVLRELIVSVRRQAADKQMNKYTK